MAKKRKFVRRNHSRSDLVGCRDERKEAALQRRIDQVVANALRAGQTGGTVDVVFGGPHRIKHVTLKVRRVG